MPKTCSHRICVLTKVPEIEQLMKFKIYPLSDLNNDSQRFVKRAGGWCFVVGRMHNVGHTWVTPETGAYVLYETTRVNLFIYTDRVCRIRVA